MQTTLCTYERRSKDRGIEANYEYGLMRVIKIGVEATTQVMRGRGCHRRVKGKRSYEVRGWKVCEMRDEGL